MVEISGMDLAQHIMMDYAHNLRKVPKKAKKKIYSHRVSQSYSGMSFLKRLEMTEKPNFLMKLHD